MDGFSILTWLYRSHGSIGNLWGFQFIFMIRIDCRWIPYNSIMSHNLGRPDFLFNWLVQIDVWLTWNKRAHGHWPMRRHFVSSIRSRTRSGWTHSFGKYWFAGGTCIVLPCFQEVDGTCKKTSGNINRPTKPSIENVNIYSDFVHKKVHVFFLQRSQTRFR